MFISSCKVEKQSLGVYTNDKAIANQKNKKNNNSGKSEPKWQQL